MKPPKKLLDDLRNLLKSNCRIFILEDDDDRITWFRRRLAGHELLIFTNAKAGIEALDADFDIIFLDHDLDLDHTDAVFEITDADKYERWLRGGRVGPQTGYDVACYIASLDTLKTIPVVIHSMNPDGARVMAEALPEAIRLSFSVLKSTL